MVRRTADIGDFSLRQDEKQLKAATFYPSFRACASSSPRTMKPPVDADKHQSAPVFFGE
jgi:hypothetical protein